MMSQFLLTVNIPCGGCFVELAANEMKIWSTMVKHRHKRVFVVPFLFTFFILLLFFFIYVFCQNLKRKGNTGSYIRAYSQSPQQTNNDANKAPGEMRRYEVTGNRK